MPSYTSFKSQVLGRGYDIDHFYGFQCWDGYAQYCLYLGVPYSNCTASGYVKDIWTNRKNNGILKYFDEVTVMEPGDIVVFKEYPGWTPVSHIAIFDSDIDGIYGNFLGQNQGGRAGANGGAVFNITRLPYAATFDTAFRLKKSVAKKVIFNKKIGAPAVKHDSDTYSSLVTNINTNAIYSSASAGVQDYSRMKIDRIVIHHNATTDKWVAMNTWNESNGKWTSAHYEVANKEIWGCVGEEYSAFHSGDSTMNRRSIGIEHANNSGAPNWTISEETYNTSAQLIADICKRYGFKPDATHIIPHKQVVSTACPGGIDMNKLIKLAQEYYNGKTNSNNQDKSTQPKKEDNLMFAIKFDTDMDGIPKGSVFTVNYNTMEIRHVPDPIAWKTIKRDYKGMTGKDIYMEHVKKGWETHRELVRYGFKFTNMPKGWEYKAK